MLPSTCQGLKEQMSHSHRLICAAPPLSAPSLMSASTPPSICHDQRRNRHHRSGQINTADVTHDSVQTQISAVVSGSDSECHVIDRGGVRGKSKSMSSKVPFKSRWVTCLLDLFYKPGRVEARWHRGVKVTATQLPAGHGRVHLSSQQQLY